LLLCGVSFFTTSDVVELIPNFSSIGIQKKNDLQQWRKVFTTKFVDGIEEVFYQVLLVLFVFLQTLSLKMAFSESLDP
jgi:hypothetical protein